MWRKSRGPPARHSQGGHSLLGKPGHRLGPRLRGMMSNDPSGAAPPRHRSRVNTLGGGAIGRSIPALKRNCPTPDVCPEPPRTTAPPAPPRGCPRPRGAELPPPMPRLPQTLYQQQHPPLTSGSRGPLRGHAAPTTAGRNAMTRATGRRLFFDQKQEVPTTHPRLRREGQAPAGATRGGMHARRRPCPPQAPIRGGRGGGA